MSNADITRKEGLDHITELLICLCATAVNQTLLHTFSLSDDELKQVYKASIAHQMTGLVATALESMEISDERFVQSKERIILFEKLVNVERNRVMDELGKHQIWHMPLKGAVLKQLYPQSWMRQMADNDILYDSAKADEVCGIMKTLGYKPTHLGIGHQDDYQKLSIFHFEMHRVLFSPKSGNRFYKYFADIEQKLLGEGLEKHLSNEDFYIYLIAHEYKHYFWMGIGLRALLDVYVFLKQHGKDLDWIYIINELKKIGIQDFEINNRMLAIKVFSEGRLDNLTMKEKKMLRHFADSGMYGTDEQGIRNRIQRDGKLKYIIHRVFLPLEDIKECYPFFYNHRFFIPCLLFYRMWNKRRVMVEEIKVLLNWKND